MKKRYLVSAILMVLTFVVSACQPAVAPTAETIIQTVVVTQEVDGETITVIETVEVEVEVEVAPGSDLTGSIRVSMWESGDALEPYNNALASFQEKYPNVEVSLEPVPQDYGTKLLADIAAGTPPDVFQLGDGDVSKYVAQGAVAPLDDFIASDSDFSMDAFFPGIANFGQVDGITYLFTKDYSPLVLYFNKDHFAEAGIELPTADWTWDDLLDAAQKLTLDGDGNNAQSPDFDSGNIVRWGLQIPAHWGDLLWLRGTLPIINAGGGSVISEDGTTVEGYLNSPAAGRHGRVRRGPDVPDRDRQHDVDRPLAVEGLAAGSDPQLRDCRHSGWARRKRECSVLGWICNQLANREPRRCLGMAEACLR
jgi:ABC-type glycerol-3-phosphate transport system substrate-binding protein